MLPFCNHQPEQTASAANLLPSMSPMAEDPRSCYVKKEGMKFTSTVTKHAAIVEEWTCCVKQEFPDNTRANCAELNCEFTDAPKKVYQRYLPAEKKQRAAVLQLSVVNETPVHQIYRADAVPELLR